MSKKRAIASRGQRLQVVRVPCDHLVYTDTEGNRANLRAGQWVEFQRKQTGRDMRELLRLGALGETDNLEQMGDDLAMLFDMLARKIVAWNWLDIDAEPDEDGNQPEMPQPSLEVLEALDFDDVMALAEMLSNQTQPEKK
jgi:hypothetical protein